jgi:hypothetical protein
MSTTVWYVWDEISAMFAYLEGIQNPMAQELPNISPRLRKCNLPSNLNPLEVLVFNSTICELGVHHHSSEKHDNSGADEYDVYLPQRSPSTNEQSSNISVPTSWDPPIGFLKLDPSWRRSKGDRFDFVAIAKEALEVSWDSTSGQSDMKHVIHTLVIETISETVEETYLGAMPVKIARRIGSQPNLRERPFTYFRTISHPLSKPLSNSSRTLLFNWFDLCKSFYTKSRFILHLIHYECPKYSAFPEHRIAYRELVPVLKKEDIYTVMVGGKVSNRTNHTKHRNSDGRRRRKKNDGNRYLRTPQPISLL